MVVETVIMMVAPPGYGKAEAVQAVTRKYNWGIHIEETTEKNPWLTPWESEPSSRIRRLRWKYKVNETLDPDKVLCAQLNILQGMGWSYHNALTKNHSKVLIVDHCPPYEVEIYSQLYFDIGLFTQAHWTTFQGHFRAWKELLRPPDLVIYLFDSTSQALEKLTASEKGQDNSHDYWVSLRTRFGDMVAKLPPPTKNRPIDINQIEPGSEEMLNIIYEEAKLLGGNTRSA